MAAADPLHRCGWAERDPLLRAYHDSKWGVHERDPRALRETLMLDGFQAGSPGSPCCASATPSGRRSPVRPFKVARFDAADVARLLADPGIIRAHAKIAATIRGAQLDEAMAARGEDFATFCWSFTDGAVTGTVRPRLRRCPSASRASSSGAGSRSSGRRSSMPGCRRSASSTTTPPTASAATRCGNDDRRQSGRYCDRRHERRGRERLIDDDYWWITEGLLLATQSSNADFDAGQGAVRFVGRENVAWVKLRLADEDRQRTFNLDQVLWWEGFGDECELTMSGTGPIRVRVSHYEMELLTNSLPRTVGD